MTSKFDYANTKVIAQNVAAGAISPCRFVGHDANGKLQACPSGSKPEGVYGETPAAAAGDIVGYHAGPFLGKVIVETDGSAACGDYVKAAGDGSGKAIKDVGAIVPTLASGGKMLTAPDADNFAWILLV
jgi:hypothetical protein